jgi:hypothetical protein
MGGRVFPDQTRRISRAEYEMCANSVVSDLSSAGFRASLVPSYRLKENFGDVDILVAGPASPLPVVTTMRDYRKHSKNGECLSFLKGDVQVDLISVPSDEMSLALAYFGWNDLGNLMGRIARCMGFRYGHRGLFAEVPDTFGNIAGKVNLSRDPEKIFNFLGYDFRTWEGGFDRLEDVFIFAASSQFFSKDCFFLHNLNHGTRVRNRKRKVYASFLQWVEPLDLSEFDYQSTSKDTWLDRAVEFFGPDWNQERDLLLSAFAKKIHLREKFNGKIVKTVTGLSGLELGSCMRSFRRNMGSCLDAWVEACPEKEIESTFMKLEGSAEERGRAAALRALKFLRQKTPLALP